MQPQNARSISHFLQKPAVQFLVFSTLFVVVAVLYGYPEIFNGPILGMHSWRQADGAAIAASYSEHGMDFFAPRMYHLLSGDGREVAEFPIIYYLVGGLFSLFGIHEGLFRGVHLLIMFMGLFNIFRLYRLILQDLFWAMALTLLVMSSPIIAYYGPNFLPDPPAFFLSVSGIYWLFRHRESGKMRHFYYLIVCFTLAGLLKITALIPFVAMVLLFGMEKVWKQGGKPAFFSGRTMMYLLGMASTLLLVAGWYAWAISYNKTHDSSYFSTRTWPIWELTGAEIVAIAQEVGSTWWKLYFSRTTWLFVLLVALGLGLARRHSDRKLLVYTGIVGLGMLAFCAMWYFNFLEHDYYFFNLLPFFVLLLVLGIDALRKQFPQLFRKRRPIAQVILLLSLLLSIRAAAHHHQDRYTPGSWVYASCNPDLYDIDPYLTEIGIPRGTPVISLPDESPNISLYAMRRPGFTELFLDNIQASDVAQFIEKGAQYFVLSTPEMQTHPAVKPFLGPQIGKWKSIAIFRALPPS